MSEKINVFGAGHLAKGVKLTPMSLRHKKALSSANEKKSARKVMAEVRAPALNWKAPQPKKSA